MTKTRKASDLPAVEALSSTDRIVTVNAQGEMQTAPSASQQIQTVRYRSLRGSTACWRRFAVMNSLETAMFIVKGSWYDGIVNAGIFAVGTAYRMSSASSTTQVASIMPMKGALTKIRVLSSANSSEHYIDMWFPGEIQEISLTAIGSCTLARFEEATEIPDGYSAREYSLTTDGLIGGGKQLLLCVLRERRAA